MLESLKATIDEIDYMAPRGLWDEFKNYWTPIQQGIYLGEYRNHKGMRMSERAQLLGIEADEFRRAIEGMKGAFLWDGTDSDPIPYLTRLNWHAGCKSGFGSVNDGPPITP